MGSAAHLGKVLFRAQHGVRSLIVTGVVAVAGEALGDGVQIKDGGAKGGNIVHLFGDALEVSAVEIVVQNDALRGGTPVHFLVPGLMDGVGLQLAGQIAVA